MTEQTPFTPEYLQDQLVNNNFGVKAALSHWIRAMFVAKHPEVQTQFSTFSTFIKTLESTPHQPNQAENLIADLLPVFAHQVLLDLAGGSNQKLDAPDHDASLALPWGALTAAILGATVTNVDIGTAVREHAPLYLHKKVDVSAIAFAANPGLAAKLLQTGLKNQGFEDTEKFNLIMLRGVMDSVNPAAGFWAQSKLKKTDIDQIKNFSKVTPYFANQVTIGVDVQDKKCPIIIT